MSDSVTWKAVSTLEYKKKQRQQQRQRLPEKEKKGFAAILGEAANAVEEKRNASGSMVAMYPTRASEIRMQDELYIQQEFLRSEDAKPRRSFHRLSSVGKSKSGRAVRALKGGTSRKVRFKDELHAKSVPLKASSSSFGPSGTGLPASRGSKVTTITDSAGALHITGVPLAASQHDTPGAATSLKVAAAAGPDPASSNAAAREQESTSTAAGVMAAAVLQAAGSSCSAIPETVVQQQNELQPLFRQSGNGALLPCQHSSSNSSNWAGGDKHVSSDGSQVTMQMCQQQQAETAFLFPGSMVTPGNRACSACSYSDVALSTTELADKQLQRLRISVAQAPSSQEQQSDLPLGYRPLAIPEATFERWNMAASGAGAVGGASRSDSRQTTRTSMELPSAAAAGGVGTASNSAPTSGSRHCSSRRSSTAGNAHSSSTHGDAAAAGGVGTASNSVPTSGSRHCSSRRSSTAGNAHSSSTHGDATRTASAHLVHTSSRDLPAHLPSTKSAQDLQALAASGCSSGRQSPAQSSLESAAQCYAGNKQRRSADYLASLASPDASLHPGRRTGSSGSPVPTSGGASPRQHPSSPRTGRHSSSSIGATPWAPGNASGAGQRSNSTMLSSEASDLDSRSPSPWKASTASAAGGPGVGNSAKSSRSGSTPLGRSSVELSAAGGSGRSHPPSAASSPSGSVGGSSTGYGSTSDMGGHAQHRLGSASAPASGYGAASAVGAQDKGVRLPDISRSGAKQQQYGAGVSAKK